ncbi:MAG: hypothetical protein J0L67_08370 [Cytophagales bacterium]|nr:hypothetical protein [Cytophagales bacterium]
MANDQNVKRTTYRERIDKILYAKALKLNQLFNEMPIRIQRLIMLGAGLGIATICVLAIKEGFNSKQTSSINIDTLTNPLLQPMEMKDDPTTLIPLGKMKGEINGQFEAFYVAMDGKGNFFMNHNPSYAKDRWLKSDDWKPLTYQQFMEYEKQLHFLSIESKSKTLKR